MHIMIPFFIARLNQDVKLIVTFCVLLRLCVVAFASLKIHDMSISLPC